MTSTVNESDNWDYNASARFWFEIIGVNTLEARTQIKKCFEGWTAFQEKPMSLSDFQSRIDNNSFSKGIAIVTGKIHRGEFAGKYLVTLDPDNQKAFEAVFSEVPIERNGTLVLETETPEDVARKTLVEYHKGTKWKYHIFFISPIPFPNMPSNKLGLEIMCNSRLIFVSNSIHEDGTHYEILGTNKPLVLTEDAANELKQHLDQVYMSHGLEYLNSSNNSKLSYTMKQMTKQLKLDPNNKILEGERNDTLLSIASSLLFQHYDNSKTIFAKQGLKNCSEQELKQFFEEVNNLCEQPLRYSEINYIWKHALSFVQRERLKDTERWEADQSENGNGKQSNKVDPNNLIEMITEQLFSNERFITIDSSRDIYHYEDGVYVNNGEIVIETLAEKQYGYSITNKNIAEIKNHIRRRTYHSAEDLDTDITIINIKNGLYNIVTGELKPHTPDYLSISQKPIVYNPDAKPTAIFKFLKEVLYYSDIGTVLDLMAYTFWRDDPYQIITLLWGEGLNGKNVFTRILTALHGSRNVSNVSMKRIIDNQFALSEMEYKAVNIDRETSPKTVIDMAVLKSLTDKDDTTIERKNQRAYSTKLFAKLFFCMNKIPKMDDDTDSSTRRLITIAFPNQFEGDKDDVELDAKLTTEQEISGLFNVLMQLLREIVIYKRGIYVTEKSLKEKHERQDRHTDPVGSFMEMAIVRCVDPDGPECVIYKDLLYHNYTQYCKQYKLSVKSDANFGKALHNLGYKDGRDSNKNGPRKRYWKNVLWHEDYQILQPQQTLD
jgi:putative DNA primase/helicase